MLPSLEHSGWKNNRLAGEGWLAVGDAGGLVDPITGEGLYYAMRSGDLASEVVLNDSHSLAERAQAYRNLLRRDFTADLEFGATLAKRVFLGRFLFSAVPSRMVDFIRRSPRFRVLIQDLFAGTQPYLGLKSRLFRNLNGTLQEVLMNVFLQRVIPEETYRAATVREPVESPLMNHSRSEELFACAQKLIPGGVNSPVRAFRGVGGTPPFIARGEGSHIFDVDGNEYIDYVRSWGPLILGHCFPPVIDALARGSRDRNQLRRAHRARSGTGRADSRMRALHRDGAPGQFRDRSHHERAARGARIHRAATSPSSLKAAITATSIRCW